MTDIITNPMTAQMDDDFVVFMLGMRINRWWRIDRWLSVARAMPRMMRELSERPELGLLGHQSWFGRTTVMVQYWRSMDHLMNYAKARDSAHLPVWREFNRTLGKTGDVGIWHETYAVRPGSYETIYHHMPPFGLGRVGQLIEARGRYKGARGRLEQRPTSLPKAA